MNTQYHLGVVTFLHLNIQLWVPTTTNKQHSGMVWVTYMCGEHSYTNVNVENQAQIPVTLCNSYVSCYFLN